MFVNPAVRWFGSAAAMTSVAVAVWLGFGSATQAGVARSGTEAASTQRVVVDDLAARVPAEWRREAMPIRGVYMFDPRHESPGAHDHAVSFSIFSSRLGSNWGLIDEAAAGFREFRSNSTYSQATVRNVHLRGVHAFEFRFRAKLDDGWFIGRKYVVVHHGRIYWITYDCSPRQTRAHLSQIKASVSSLRSTRGPYDPDIRTVVVTRTPTGMLSFRITFRHPTELTGATQLQVMLDTDRKQQTGIQGSEYALDYSRARIDGPSTVLITVHGKNSLVSKPRSLHFRSTPTSATFQIASKALRKPGVFGFRVFAARGDAFIDEVPLKGVAVGRAEWIYPAPSSKSATVRYTSS